MVDESGTKFEDFLFTQRRLDSQTVAVTFSRTFDFSISEECKHIENKKY